MSQVAANLHLTVAVSAGLWPTDTTSTHRFHAAQSSTSSPWASARRHPSRARTRPRSRPPQVSSPSPRGEPIALGLASGCFASSCLGVWVWLASALTLRFRCLYSASNCLICEPLADHAAKQNVGALLVVHAVRDTVVIPEVELGHVAVQ